jgi:hypothetical protein
MTPSWVIPLTTMNLAALALLALYLIGSWVLLITAYYRLKWISVLEEYIGELERGVGV